MQKRLLNMLASGGVAMLCFAPQFLAAEDESSIPPMASRPWTFSNMNDTVPVIPRAASSAPVVTGSNAPSAQPSAEDQGPLQYRPLIEEISRANGVDPDLIDALMKTESNYNRWAISSKGARGLMQLIPETGRRFGVTDFFDPRQNIEGGVRYIRFLLDMFHGNVDLALAAYNAGENLVARLGKIPPIPETRKYVNKIRAVYTKPSSRAITTAVKVAPVKLAPPVIPEAQVTPAQAVPAKKDSAASPISPEKSKNESVAPVSSRVDERGVIHFSNIESFN